MQHELRVGALVGAAWPPFHQLVPDSPLTTALVAFLAVQPAAIARLRALHVDDGRGHCRACGSSAQGGHLVWPCQLRLAADAAEVDMLAARRR